MAFTYTDSDKIVLEAWGKFRVTLYEDVEAGDLLHWYNTDNAYTVRHADDSDGLRANCIAMEDGSDGDEIWACLKAVLGTITTQSGDCGRGIPGRVYFAGEDDFLGAPLYLGEAGKPESDEGGTYVQTVGYLLARDRILLDLDPSISVFQGGVVRMASWGTVIGSGSLYLKSDYSVYLNAWAAGKLEMVGSLEVRMRVAGKGFSVIPGGRISTAYGILCTALIDLAAGMLSLPQRADPLTASIEGYVWYNTTQDKLQFRTATGNETVTSA